MDEEEFSDDEACNICNQKVCACDEIYDAWRDSKE